MRSGGLGAALDAVAVRRVLPSFFGPVEVAASLPSTMLRAAELAQGGAPEGAVVLADVQTAGRGRLGRRWAAPPGAALMLSVVLRPQLAPERTWTVLAAAGVALAEAASGLLGAPRPSVRPPPRKRPADSANGPTAVSEASIRKADSRQPRVALKWPNDLLVGGRKAAGLLAERHTTGRGVAVVLGMGVNVSQSPEELPEEARDRATSLAVAAAAAGAAPPDRLDLLAPWSRGFAARYRGLDPDGRAILPVYRRHLDTLGRRVRVDRLAGPPVQGTAVDVTADGSLVVQLAGGTRVEVATGDVEHLRPA